VTAGGDAPIRRLSSRLVYANPYLRLREDAIEQPDGTRGIYSVVEKPDFALVVPFDGERLHLVGQYRYPVGSFEWEFPQGGVEGFDAQDPEAVAARELEEETGLSAGRLEHLGHLWHAYGFSQQGFDAFLATDLRQGEHRREPSEQTMRSRTVAPDELEAMVLSGELRDAPSVAAWGLVRLRSSLP
jgi:8-oxo-dGTP pyrophosphatase MutT (NUDIX family)